MVFGCDNGMVGLTCVVGSDVSDFVWTVWVDVVDTWYGGLINVVCVCIVMGSIVVVIEEVNGDLFYIIYFVSIIEIIIIAVYVVVR